MLLQWRTYSTGSFDSEAHAARNQYDCLGLQYTPSLTKSTSPHDDGFFQDHQSTNEIDRVSRSAAGHTINRTMLPIELHLLLIM